MKTFEKCHTFFNFQLKKNIVRFGLKSVYVARFYRCLICNRIVNSSKLKIKICSIPLNIVPPWKTYFLEKNTYIYSSWNLYKRYKKNGWIYVQTPKTVRYSELAGTVVFLSKWANFREKPNMSMGWESGFTISRGVDRTKTKYRVRIYFGSAG